MDETVHRPNWIGRNWKWLIPVVVLVALFAKSLPKGIGNAMMHIIKGYSDPEIPENALEILRKNERSRWISRQ